MRCEGLGRYIKMQGFMEIVRWIECKLTVNACSVRVQGFCSDAP